MSLKKSLRRFIPFPRRKTIKRWFPDYWAKNTAHLLAKHGVTLVLDVGANVGQYGQMLRSAGYKGRIVSFEPQKSAWEAAHALTLKDPAWTMADRAAIGDKNGELPLNVTKDSCLASMLTPAESATFDGFEIESQELVPVKRLDDVAPQYIREDDVVLLKIDVQGFERQVIAGAKETLKRCHGLHLELAIKPLYEGEPYYLDLLEEMKNEGFALVALAPVMSRMKLGEWEQFDGMLFRADWLERWSG